MYWICFKTKSKEEFIAENALIGSGYKVILPYYFKSIRHARKVKEVKSPLFPTYGFLLFDGNISSLYEIKYSRGVKHYLQKIDGYPQLVPEKIIQSDLYKYFTYEIIYTI